MSETARQTIKNSRDFQEDPSKSKVNQSLPIQLLSITKKFQ